MNLGGVVIEDTFAEAFRMRWCRLVITAADEHWAQTAAVEATGYGSSIIACDAEAGIERYLAPEETPDGRPGAAALFFAFNLESLSQAARNRAGQCVLTCPTTALYDGFDLGGAPESEPFPLGKLLRYFGDGYQKSKRIAGRRYWRIPVMDGEFLVEENARAAKGIGGGNFLIQGESQPAALAAARRAIEAIAPLPGVITPFPGGIARSGSKVGSRYPKLRASTNEAFCPTLRSRAATQLHPEASALYEIIVDGISEDAVARALRAGISAACAGGRDAGVAAISAGNYGGSLGKFHFRLHELMR